MSSADMPANVPDEAAAMSEVQFRRVGRAWAQHGKCGLNAVMCERPQTQKTLVDIGLIGTPRGT